MRIISLLLIASVLSLALITGVFAYSSPCYNDHKFYDDTVISYRTMQTSYHYEPLVHYAFYDFEYSKPTRVYREQHPAQLYVSSQYDWHKGYYHSCFDCA